MFASSGEGLKDFDVFHPDRMASRILDMGDMLTLIEQAEKAFDQEQSQAAAAKLMAGKGEFGLDDFLGLMRQMRHMGPMSKIMGMLPGVGQMKDQIENIDEREIDRIEAIICAMTPAERADVSVLNGSRRARIAKGSGVEVRDVNNLVNRFVDARKMMSQMGQMMGPGAGRMMGSMAKRGSKQSKKKKKNRKGSGNPAKRAAQARQAAEKPHHNSGEAFGVPGQQQPSQEDLQKAMSEFKMPPSMQQMFDQTNKGPR